MSNSGVYKIYCSLNGEMYVGSTSRLDARKNEHFCKLRNGKHPNKKLQAVFDAHGEESISFSVIEYVAKEFLLDREQAILDTTERLLNIATDAKIPGKGPTSHIGRKLSEDSKRKIGIANKCRIVTDDVRKRTGQTMVRIGHHVGEKSPNSKLTWKLVDKIKVMRSCGIQWNDIALEVGVSKRTAIRAFNGESWRVKS